MPTVRTPEASQYARHITYWISAFPIRRKGSATSITFNFGAKFPFTFVSAYCLPVYASQWPLPDTTQDSVHGCWLSFAMVVISNYRISCACKAQSPKNRACEFPRTRLKPLQSPFVGAGGTTFVFRQCTCLWQLGCTRTRLLKLSLPPSDFGRMWCIFHPVSFVIFWLQFGQLPSWSHQR